ncbi:hypothetical protein [Nonomuraea sp. NPDC049480]
MRVAPVIPTRMPVNDRRTAIVQATAWAFEAGIRAARLGRLD